MALTPEQERQKAEIDARRTAPPVATNVAVQEPSPEQMAELSVPFVPRGSTPPVATPPVAPETTADTQARRVEEADFVREYAPSVTPQMAPVQGADVSRLTNNSNYGLGAFGGQADSPLALPSDLPEPTEDDGSDYLRQLQDARASDRQRASIADVLGSVQRLSSAISGTPWESDFYERAGAPRAVPELEQNNKLAVLAQQERQRREATDPNSRSSRMAQAAFVDFINMAAPGLKASFPGEQVAKMNRQQIEAVMGPHAKLMGDLESMRAKRAGEEAQLARIQNETARLNLQRDQAQGRFQEKGYDTAQDLLGKGGQVNGYQDGINRRNFVSKLQKFREKNEATDKLASAFEEIERVVPGFTTGEVPDDMSPEILKSWLLNRVNAKGITSRWTSQDMVRFNTARDDILNTLRHASAGANLTDSEIEFWDRMFQSNLMNDPNAVAAVMSYFRKRVGNVYNRQLEGLQAEGSLLFGDQWQDVQGSLGHLDRPVFNMPDAPSRPASMATPTRAPQAPEANVQHAPGGARVTNKATGKSKIISDAATLNKLAQDPNFIIEMPE